MTTSRTRLATGVLLAVAGAIGTQSGAAAVPTLQQLPTSMTVALREFESLNGDGGGAVDRGPDLGSLSAAAARQDTRLPARSGQGRRVVVDLSEQRVWLVGRRERVQRTYLVSGGRENNLRPGRHEVYSRSRDAVSYDYRSTMRFMVRFAHGERAAIGFHDIPEDRRGRKVQTRDQLGTRLSAGCLRQARPDAVEMWRFADLGTRVVVVR